MNLPQLEAFRWNHLMNSSDYISYNSTDFFFCPQLIMCGEDYFSQNCLIVCDYVYSIHGYSLNSLIYQRLSTLNFHGTL